MEFHPLSRQTSEAHLLWMMTLIFSKRKASSQYFHPLIHWKESEWHFLKTKDFVRGNIRAKCHWTSMQKRIWGSSQPLTWHQEQVRCNGEAGLWRHMWAWKCASQMPEFLTFPIIIFLITVSLEQAHAKKFLSNCLHVRIYFKTNPWRILCPDGSVLRSKPRQSWNVLVLSGKNASFYTWAKHTFLCACLGHWEVNLDPQASLHPKAGARQGLESVLHLFGGFYLVLCL